jgi:hypothetical protein
VCLLGLLVLSCASSSTIIRPGGPLEFSWGSSKRDLITQYGERIRLLPRRPEASGSYDDLEIGDYEFEGLLFAAKLRVDRDIDALSEVILVRSSSAENRHSLLSEYDRLDGVFTKLLGVTNARYGSGTGAPVTVARGAIWSKGSPWVLLRYEYVEGFMNSLIIHIRQSSRTRLVRITGAGILTTRAATHCPSRRAV